MSKKKIGIIGATGYTGSELVRILLNHSEVSIESITSESRAGEKFSDVHPSFLGLVDFQLEKAAQALEKDLDLVFLALPHGVSMDFAPQFLDKGIKVVDLSGDFRLNTPEQYSMWYKKEHSYPEGFAQAVYGLPELHSHAIKQASLVANPGCYPTASILSVAPLAKEGLVDPKTVIIDAKSGVTGAGVKAKPVSHFSNVNENFKAYGIKGHRHTIEIQEQLEGIGGGNNYPVQFTPHLLPLDRGILATSYATPNKKMSEQEVKDLYASFYEPHPFVRICPAAPSLKDVRATNYCNVFVTYDERTNRVIALSAIDNLVKGAAGQAVHNMNLIFGFEQTLGLKLVPVNP